MAAFDAAADEGGFAVFKAQGLWKAIGHATAAADAAVCINGDQNQSPPCFREMV